jgi:CDP-glucose 4,6-dehydratase
MSSSLEPTILNEATNEIHHQYLSASKARRELGWKPLYSLEEGLERAISWYGEYLGVKQ